MSEEVAAAWFLVSESDEPLGHLNRARDEAIPSVGAVLNDVAARGRAQVVQFTELRQSCAVRRFRVTVRIIG